MCATVTDSIIRLNYYLLLTGLVKLAVELSIISFYGLFFCQLCLVVFVWLSYSTILCQIMIC